LRNSTRAARLHYNATSPNSNIITGITSEKLEDGWMFSKAQKTAFLGVAGLIRAGGPGDEADKLFDRPTFHDDKVPACWHSMPREFWEEIIHSYAFTAVFVPTVMDDQAAMACIISGTPGVFMVFTEEQRTLLRERLLALIWLEFRDPQSRLYQAGVSKIIGAKAAAKAVGKAAPTGEETTRRVRTAQARITKPEEGAPEEEERPKRKALKAKKDKPERVKKAKLTPARKGAEEADDEEADEETTSDLDLSDG
jgi:hypothetical protein